MGYGDVVYLRAKRFETVSSAGLHITNQTGDGAVLTKGDKFHAEISTLGQ